MKQDLQYELVVEHKTNLYARLYNPETKESIIKTYGPTDYVPPIFVPSKNQEKYKSFTNDENLSRKEYPNIFELNKAVKSFRELNIPVYGNTNRYQHYISQNFPTPLDSTHVMRTWFLDIETRSINGFAQPSNPTEEISLIQIYDNFLKEFLILSVKECKEVPKSEFGAVRYLVYDNEVDMMRNFLKILDKLNPTVIAGFNSNFFDIP